MNTPKVTQIKKTSALYYVVGIVIFSAIAGIVALIVEIVKQNSWCNALNFLANRSQRCIVTDKRKTYMEITGME